MDEEELTQEKILIVSDYPHQILMHIRKILKQKKRDFLLQESLFLMEFKKTFPEETEEYKVLQTGYQIGVIPDFAAYNLEPKWQKRVFVQKSLFHLQKQMKERDAVALLESLMNIFQWNFSVEAKRKWKVSPKDMANFHAFQKPKQDKKGASLRQNSPKKGQPRGTAALPLQKQPPVPDVPLTDTAAASTKKKNAGHNTGKDDFPYHEVNDVIQTLEEDHPEKKYNIFIVEEGRTISSPQEVKHYSKMRLSDRKHIKKAIAGNEKSQCYLGDFYSEENSDHLDYPEAVYWYQLSANQGNYKARMQLATIYDGGYLKGKDTKRRGIECFRELAEEGFPTAQCILGMKYLFGDGIEENRGIAVKWLKKAAEQGHDEAIKLLERFIKS